MRHAELQRAHRARNSKCNIYLSIKFSLPVEQFSISRLLERSDEARTLISFVSDSAEGGRHDVRRLCFSEGGHIVIMPSNGLGHEEKIAPEACDGLTVKSRSLMFSRPGSWLIAPGPGRCQEAVYQHRLLPSRNFPRLVDGRPVLFGGRLDKRREFRNDPRDHRLRRVEYFRPDFLGYVLPYIPACYNNGFSQRKVLRTPESLTPRLLKLIFDTPYQFIKLL